MKDVILSKRYNLWLFFYRYSCVGYNTNNLCPLTWNGLIGFILFLITWPYFIVWFIATWIRDRMRPTMYDWQEQHWYFFGPLLLMALLIVGYVFSSAVIISMFNLCVDALPWWLWLVAVFFFPVIFFALSLALFLGVGAAELVQGGGSAVIDSVPARRISAWYHGVCPHINWKEDEDTT